ncbi:gamma-glutamylcyclotransferase family protein [Baaleninema sp.]|uniref:gamma-glutamylcyclotransferase family protein n=1 Tax=Baaleninema sp. TaxID=3101197 RepID=UPI003D07050B
MIRVFVYGTLQPGERFHKPYCGDRVVATQAGKVRGRLYHLPPVNYPAMTVGEDWVEGVVLTLNHVNALEKLDELEGYKPHRPASQNEYNRYEIDVFDLHDASKSLCTAWAYFMTRERVRSFGGIWLKTGKWQQRAR